MGCERMRHHARGGYHSWSRASLARRRPELAGQAEDHHVSAQYIVQRKNGAHVVHVVVGNQKLLLFIAPI